MLASVPLIPKFASEVTAMVCELRNRDTSVARLRALRFDGVTAERFAIMNIFVAGATADWAAAAQALA